MPNERHTSIIEQRRALIASQSASDSKQTQFSENALSPPDDRRVDFDTLQVSDDFFDYNAVFQALDAAPPSAAVVKPKEETIPVSGEGQLLAVAGSFALSRRTRQKGQTSQNAGNDSPITHEEASAIPKDEKQTTSPSPS